MKQLKLCTIIGIIFVIAIGSLAHFMYEWTDHSFVIGLFAPVNESVREHMKLVFFPMLVYSIFMNSKFRKSYPGITASLCLGIITGTLLVPLFFYGYTAVIGHDAFALDIADFVLSIVIGFTVAYKLAPSRLLKRYTLPLCCLVCIFLICLVIFTYSVPAHNPLSDG